MRKIAIWILSVIIMIGISGCSVDDSIVGEEEVPVRLYEDDDSVMSAGNAAYEQERYEDALNLYLDALDSNPKTFEARMGIARTLEKLGAPERSVEYIVNAITMESTNLDAYDFLIHLGREHELFYVIETALQLAEENGVGSRYEDLRPEPPQASLDGGTYYERMELEFTTDQEDAEIVYDMYGYDPSYYSIRYTDPIKLTQGPVTVTAACLKDGVLSRPLRLEFNMDYPSLPVTFIDSTFEYIVRDQLGKPTEDILDTECENVYYLDLDYWNVPDDVEMIKTLEDVKWFPNLTGFYFDNYRYSYVDGRYTEHTQDIDLSPVLQLRDLYNLELRYCDLEDLSFVDNMPNLHSLSVPDNNISDISALANHPDLEYLYIGNNPIRDLSPLGKLVNLRGLEIYGLEISDISWIADLDMLTYLAFNNNNVSDISALRSLTQLEDLSFSNNNISDISPLAGMTQMRYLYFYNNSVSDISPLEKLVELEYLYFGGNPVRDLSPVENLPKLSNKDDILNGWYPAN